MLFFHNFVEYKLSRNPIRKLAVETILYVTDLIRIDLHDSRVCGQIVLRENMHWWKFIHILSYILSDPFADMISARTGWRHLEHVARAIRDDSFQFSWPRKARIPTRQFLAEIDASWRNASWDTERPRVKSRASLG